MYRFLFLFIFIFFGRNLSSKQKRIWKRISNKLCAFNSYFPNKNFFDIDSGKQINTKVEERSVV